jgi:hypothetical protein
MFVVDARENELLVCQICEHAFQSLSSAWLASPADGGAAIWVHRHCVSAHGTRLLGGLRYRLRRGDSVIRALVQRLLTVDTSIMEQLAADVHDPHVHRLGRYSIAQLAIGAAETYGRLLHVHERQVELDQTRAQLAALQARWDRAERERGWD